MATLYTILGHTHRWSAVAAYDDPSSFVADMVRCGGCGLSLIYLPESTEARQALIRTLIAATFDPFNPPPGIHLVGINGEPAEGPGTTAFTDSTPSPHYT